MSGYPSYGSPSREVLVKQATQGGFALAGGVALLVFHGLAGIPVLGPIIGGAMLVAGLALRSKGSRGDNVTSLALTVLGGLAVATIIPGIGGLAGGLMWLSGLGLIGVGVWKLLQYRSGLRRRSE